jgi:hypothetical protein
MLPLDLRMGKCRSHPLNGQEKRAEGSMMERMVVNLDPDLHFYNFKIC